MLLWLSRTAALVRTPPAEKNPRIKYAVMAQSDRRLGKDVLSGEESRRKLIKQTE